MVSATTPPLDAAIWERVIQFEKPLSSTAARALLAIKFGDGDRKRMRELLAKSRSATLTTEEESEAEAYERLGCLLDILHSKARRVLKRRRTAS
jgi:hypothetical protein